MFVDVFIFLTHNYDTLIEKKKPKLNQALKSRETQPSIFVDFM